MFTLWAAGYIWYPVSVTTKQNSAAETNREFLHSTDNWSCVLLLLVLREVLTKYAAVMLLCCAVLCCWLYGGDTSRPKYTTGIV